MSDKIVRLRDVAGAQVLESLNCAAISKRFFNRSRAWFIQRLNNNQVNGKPVSFSANELRNLCKSLRSLASELNEFADNIRTDK